MNVPALLLYLLMTLPLTAETTHSLGYDGFSFEPPASWPQLSTEQFRIQILKPVTGTVSSSTRWIPHPKVAFQAPDSSLCVVSFLEPRGAVSADPGLEIVDGFELQLKPLGTVSRVDVQAHGLTLHQVRVVSKSMFILKTVFRTTTGKVAQIDLYVPIDRLDTQRAALETSLTSLSPSTEKSSP